MIRTSSGRVFGRSKETKKERTELVTNYEYLEFVNMCPRFGLSPDFYEHGCVTDAGEFYYLIGFDKNMAKLRNLAGIGQSVTFKKALQMMHNQLDVELEELAEKAELLFIERDTKTGKQTFRDVKANIKDRRTVLDASLKVFNGLMNEVIEDMHMPPESLNCGVMLGNSLFEFVSYRADLGDKPYIVDNIERPSSAPARFRNISFSALQAGILKYKNSLPKDAYEVAVLNEVLNNMKPIKNKKSKNDMVIDVCVDVNIKEDIDTQQQLFIF